jgi:hypothetical protein
MHLRPYLFLASAILVASITVGISSGSKTVMGAESSNTCAAEHNSIFEFEVDEALSDGKVSLSKYKYV